VAIDQLVEEIQKMKDDKFIYYYKKVVEEGNTTTITIDVKIRRNASLLVLVLV
jgi:hypothetical protein